MSTIKIGTELTDYHTGMTGKVIAIDEWYQPASPDNTEVIVRWSDSSTSRILLSELVRTSWNPYSTRSQS